MAILVVGSNEASSLAEALQQRGEQIATIATADAVPNVGTAPLQLAVCLADRDSPPPLQVIETLAANQSALPIILVGHHELSAGDLLRAMRLGVVDVVAADAPLDEQLRAIAHCRERLRLQCQHEWTESKGGKESKESTESTEQPPHHDAARGSGDDGQARSSGQPQDWLSRPEQLRVKAQLRELQRDQRAGRYIQLGMLPPSPMAIGDYRLRHKIVPSLMLSGDFVDYFRVTDRHFAFYIADVSGHGASSAFVTVLLKNFSRRLRREYTPRMLRVPGDVLVWLNRELLDNQLDKHVALFLGIVDLDGHELVFANAGHYPSAILTDNDGTRMLEITGKPVGLFRDIAFDSEQVALPPGASLSLVSDGVLEVLGDGRLAAKEQRLLEAAAEAHSGGKELWEILRLADHTSNPDDMACLTVTRSVAA